MRPDLLRSKQTSSSGNRAAEKVLYSLIAVVSLAGLADATFLTVQALTGETLACGGSAGCSEVLGSAYARVGDVPVAAFGILGYFAAFTCATFAAFDYARAASFLKATVGALFVATLWLLFVQRFILHAWCRYCLFSAAVTFVLAGLSLALPAGARTRK